ncbi:sn-glycerol-1-phosphate dehydrogenase [Chelativorans alearense]|uniref:sn-glycerol-1-phosphate dehydrogenase n=1 Tax=Chelativorans alearense TaxID=2681495 RepID=UPI0013D3BB4B|nr:sn-glycerol-1-phosphate dehydrogenase [Chelativorans alearense]
MNGESSQRIERKARAEDVRDRRYAIPAVEQSKAIESVVVGHACLQEAGAVFRRHFGAAPALIVADENTYGAAGEAVRATLVEAGINAEVEILPAKPRLAPDRLTAEHIAARIGEMGAANDGVHPVPLAVGSGVINDLTRYAAFSAGTRFMSVPTAASMDGYTSAGAPLSDEGFKITIQCAPPRVILADLDVVAGAPARMSGWGYGDLAGKVPAGGDWLVADALGVEALDDTAWPMVQNELRGWLSDPNGVRRGDGAAIADLFIGLAVSGVAMEVYGSSRPASGAEHQIAHIWEMEDLSHEGEKVSHGACVAIGSLSMLSLYDWLLDQDISAIDPAAATSRAPDWSAVEAAIDAAFPNANVARRAKEEMREKWVEHETLTVRLARLRDGWPALRDVLASHLMREIEMRDLLAAAGAPVTTREIGLSPERHRATMRNARWIRRRYTLLDLLADAGLLEPAVEACFPDGAPLYS